MAELKYKCGDFHIEPYRVLLDASKNDGVHITISCSEDTPKCIKERLDQIVNYEFNEYLSNNEGCKLCPSDFSLDADLILEIHKETGTQYFLSIMLLDLIARGASDEILIQESYLITQDDADVYNALKSYFRNYVNNTLFPE